MPPKTKIAISLTCLLTAAGLCICQDAANKRTGKLPVDFPSVTTAAKAEQFVLAAEKASVEESFTKGIDKTVFAFYLGTMVEPGQAESKIKTIYKYEEMVPNSVIIPLTPDQSASPGDVVVAAWRQGLGLQQGIVVAGGDEKEPNVAFFCDKVDSPDAIKTSKCPKGTFTILKDAYQPGTSVAVRGKEGGFTWAIVICASGEKILALDHAGKLSSPDKTNCSVIPISPTLKEGDAAMVVVDGKFVAGKVKNVAAAVGRVFVTVQDNGKETVVGAPFGSVTASLP